MCRIWFLILLASFVWFGSQAFGEDVLFQATEHPQAFPFDELSGNLLPEQSEPIPGVTPTVSSYELAPNASQQQTGYQTATFQTLPPPAVSQSQEAFATPTSGVEATESTIGIDIYGPPQPVSNKSWHVAADLLLFNPEFGSVNFQSSEGDNELMSGFRFMFAWESKSQIGLRLNLASSSGEGIVDTSSLMGTPTDIIVDILSSPNPEDYVFSGFDYPGASPLSSTAATLETIAATFNLGIYKRLQRNRWDLILGASLSGAGLDLTIPEVVENEIITGGYSLFGEGTFEIFKSEVKEISLAGGVRIAQLSGEWEARDDVGSAWRDTDMTLTEANLGLEWKRLLGKAVLALRAQYEYQLWNSDVTRDFVLNGAALRAGISW